MSNGDCIDPRIGDWIRCLITKSLEESTAQFSFDPAALTEARIHWNTCPFCRTAFPSAGASIPQVAVLLEATTRDGLTALREEFDTFLKQVSSTAPDERAASIEILTCLSVQYAPEVNWLLSYIYGEANVFTAFTSAAPEPELGADRLREPLSKCAPFLVTLDAETQWFVFAAMLCDELLYPLTLEYRFPVGGDSPLPEDWDAYKRDGVRSELLNEELRPDVLWKTVQSAATTLAHGTVQTHRRNDTVQRVSGSSPADKSSFNALLAEMKRGFQDVLDGQDSLKAGQMEIIRRNSARAEDYAERVAQRLGAHVYSRISENTRLSLNNAEFLYNLVVESDCFFAPAMALATAYEQELTIRVVWPFICQLLDKGIADFGSLERPLLRASKVMDSNFGIGTLAYYLNNSDEFRKHTSDLGLDVNAIAKDASVVKHIRNKAAHEARIPRALVDDLRKRMFDPNGILSRLYSAASNAASAQ